MKAFTVAVFCSLPLQGFLHPEGGSRPPPDGDAEEELRDLLPGPRQAGRGNEGDHELDPGVRQLLEHHHAV